MGGGGNEAKGGGGKVDAPPAGPGAAGVPVGDVKPPGGRGNIGGGL